ncbi:MAG TPA: hypothetical protein PLQ76_08370, partial [bacterium]|nr:hypothetical protein [bacterium]
PVKVATFLLNEKREAIRAIEQRHRIGVLLIPNQSLDTPHFKLTRLRVDELSDEQLRSYALAEDYEEPLEPRASPVTRSADEEPVVNSLKTSAANVEFTMRTSIASLRTMADDDFGDFIPRLGKELSRGAKFGTTYTGVFAKDGSLVSGGFDSPVSGIVFVLAPGNTAQDVREVLLPLENVILENGGAAVNAALDADGDLEPVFNQSRHPFFKDTATLKSQIDMILRVDEIFKQKKETHTVAK